VGGALLCTKENPLWQPHNVNPVFLLVFPVVRPSLSAPLASWPGAAPVGVAPRHFLGGGPASAGCPPVALSRRAAFWWPARGPCLSLPAALLPGSFAGRGRALGGLRCGPPGCSPPRGGSVGGCWPAVGGLGALVRAALPPLPAFFSGAVGCRLPPPFPPPSAALLVLRVLCAAGGVWVGPGRSRWRPPLVGAGAGRACLRRRGSRAGLGVLAGQAVPLGGNPGCRLGARPLWCLDPFRCRPAAAFLI